MTKIEWCTKPKSFPVGPLQKKRVDAGDREVREKLKNATQSERGVLCFHTCLAQFRALSLLNHFVITRPLGNWDYYSRTRLSYSFGTVGVSGKMFPHLCTRMIFCERQACLDPEEELYILVVCDFPHLLLTRH